MPNSPPPDRPGMPLVWNEPPTTSDISDPARFDGITWRRVVAYLIDALLLFGIGVLLWLSVLLSLGLLYPLALLAAPAIPLAYHTLQVAGVSAATIGMRMMGVTVRRLDGGRPELFQAFLQTALFYASVTVTGSLILLIALFNERGRCLHDWLSGTVTVRTQSLAEQ